MAVELSACIKLSVVSAGMMGAEVRCIPLDEAIGMPMSTSCGSCCIGDVHGDVCVRGVGAQELVYALLGMPRVEAVLGRQPVEVVVAPCMSEESLVRDHHAGAIPPIQWGGAVWGSLVAGAVGLGE
eukprot:9472219-Pyramimonas_sp.AAC.1